jgi:hypothetical protein
LTAIREAVNHPLSPFRRRTLYSILIVIVVLAVGTEVLHDLEGWSYVDSFYFISFVATTQGPTFAPRTDVGKIFASVMAFVSAGAVLSALVFVFGPLLGTLVKVGFDFVEREERRLKGKLERENAPGGD